VLVALRRCQSVLRYSFLGRKEPKRADPMVCPRCGGKMRVIAFLIDYAVVDKIINHLKLTFVADRPPPPHIAYQEVLMAADPSAEYFS
jgi:hypothetical protein